MNWLTEYPLLILTAIAITSFLESFALVGLLVPGVVVLFSLTALAQHAGISVWPLLLAGVIGGLIGDISSFLIGWHLQDRIHRWSWLKRHESWLDQGQWFIKKWGWLSVIIGRFLGPIRPVVPLVAGTLGMRRMLFIPLSSATVLAWAPAYLLPGYYTGELSGLWQLQPLSTRSLIVYLLTAMALSGCALAIYHHAHPHRWHLKGWLTEHQAERWPISAAILLCCCLLALFAIHQWSSQQLDTTFHAWSALWKHNLLAPYWAFIRAQCALPVALGSAVLCVLWLLIAIQLRLAVLFCAGAALLMFAIQILFPAPTPSTAQGLALMIYLAGFSANLINHRTAALNKWPVYFLASQWVVLVMTSQIWEGTLLLSETLTIVCFALLMNSLLRISWQLWHIPQRLPPFTAMLWLIICVASSGALLLP